MILTIPLTEASTENVTSAWVLVLNSEALQRHSLAAQRRGVPSYTTVESIMSVLKTSFDPEPHPLFVDQVYSALRLAFERADEKRSPLYPYLRLLAPFDDEFIREIHRGVLDSQTHLEYSDHGGRFSHCLRQIRRKWLDEYEVVRMIETSCGLFLATASPDKKRCFENPTTPSHEEEVTHRQSPPSMEDWTWACRLVLSRQRLLPLRHNVEPFERVCTERKRMQAEEDAWAHLVNNVRWTLLDRVFGVVEHKRAVANDFDPRAIASVVPVLDMLQYPRVGWPTLR
ncbi:hypothetical protein TraAM80_03130 [Trypanosoma rangeli]|uniref:Uncharacterized protein n=1 Tax=Trypanosoma rangeli TaxID=5698 RepID=A0A3R7MTG8_TRYRA|nr:uncharacterized protein TraAM80_03130 [Trypanosoma rangeli]RNF07872.1 hypothetical protein TraAM80_03130 [Trypanosoma rangeli]|eukprot:RNF07872.1 hypothetical protein TraAM80_03130 [Trypanosoma rangeli]